MQKEISLRNSTYTEIVSNFETSIKATNFNIMLGFLVKYLFMDNKWAFIQQIS